MNTLDINSNAEKNCDANDADSGWNGSSSHGYEPESKFFLYYTCFTN